MGVGGDKFCLIGEGCGVDNGIRHGQLMAKTQFGGCESNVPIKIGNLPAQGFSDKFVCNCFALPKKENFPDFKNDYGGNDDAPLVLQVGRE